jgi:hypothetical protein
MIDKKDKYVMEVASQPSPGPQTVDEARQFHDGFLAGATAYAASIGHSTLKSDNEKLREVFDVQGWKTLESFEKLNSRQEYEDLAAQFRAAQRATEDGKPDGSCEALERCAKMLDTYGPECFPANDKGQVHFARAMMESTADEIRAFLYAMKE